MEGDFTASRPSSPSVLIVSQQHIMLDQETGLDPPDIKLRAAMGFDATDFFVTGYD